MTVQLPMRKLLAVLFLTAFSFTAAYAQLVTGKIISKTDAAGVAGASIEVKGSSKGASADASGTFTINAKTGDVLIISALGFKQINYTVNKTSGLIIELETDARSLNEVVVTALGIKKETKKLSYAIQEVKTADLVKAREPNPINSLKGKVAGLVVNINSELLRQPSINFRGQGNILFVVDGIPIRTDTWNISPDDIESYSFLKGQTAAALYGSNAVDGAIIINTKKGTKDKRGFSVEFNSSTMFENGFLAFPRLQDEYGPGSTGKYAFKDGVGGGVNDNDYDIWGPRFEGQLLPQYDGEVVPGQTFTTTFRDGSTFTGNIRPTPWLARGKDNLGRFLQTGLLSTNHISIASQTDKYDLRFGMGHTYQRAIVPNMGLNITNFNMASGYNFSKKVRLSANINYSRQYSPNFPDVNYGPNSLIYNVGIWAGSDWSVDDMKNYWQEGKVGIQQKYAEYQRYNNPWFMVKEWLRGHYKNDLYGYVTLDWKFAPNFNVMLRPGISTYGITRTEKMPYSAGSYGRDDRKGDYREDNRNLFESNNEVQVRYNNKLFKNILQLDGMVGGNIQNIRYNSVYATTNYLNVPGVYNLNNSLLPVRTFNWSAEQLVLSGYYSFDFGVSKYLTVSTTGRLDKHSNLPDNKYKQQYFYFSTGAATVVSDYIKLPDVVSFLKLKGSYATGRNPQTISTIGPLGFIGGNPLDYGDTYQSPYGIGRYAFAKYTYSLGFGYNNSVVGSFTNRLNDPDIAADNRKTTEAGIDIRFFKNRLALDVTYFSTLSELLGNRSISSATGYDQITVNSGVTRNRGVEAVLSGTAIQKKNFSWNVLVNWSTFKRVWVDNPNPTPWIKNGDRVDLVVSPGFVKLPDGRYLHNTDGLLMRMRDAVNGGNAQRIFGHGDPDFVWGITNNLRYKNFSLAFQFDGVVGGLIWNQIRRRTISGGRHLETVQGEWGVHRPNDVTGGTFVGAGVTWVGVKPIVDPVTGEITNFKDLTIVPNTKAVTVQNYASRYASSSERDFIFQDRTFAKLREVTLTYNIPANVLKHAKFISSMNVSLVGRNLILFYNESKDVDPDQFTQQVFSDIQSPSTRRYGFNINIIF
ncbi:MAG: SusC/RagA family TonB-linked outer membrane protein [Chitinophagaceae bacterium]|nr:SusC/RagA family TonB-linked outer membrane protein [Chitinophagaceae bacterium]